MLAKEGSKDDKIIASKLHRQFAHPNSETLNRIIKNAGIKNKNLEKEIRCTTDKCITCIKHKRRLARPIVSLPMAYEFNEMIAIDLKTWGKSYFLVIVDLATRFCSACVINNKLPSTIIKGLFLSWIVIFGPPKKLLSDNGGEFVNSEMITLSEAFSIKILNTAAESPWSNGVCERLNGVLGKLVLKILDDVNCDVQIALAWAVSARNAYYNNSGFSPNQLVFGFNPSMPDIYNSKVPGFEKVTSSDIVRKNLQAQNAAKQEFVKFDACERIKRALSNNVRTSLLEDLRIDDEIYFKRNISDVWQGPAKVTNIERKIVTVRYFNKEVRVHTASLIRVPTTIEKEHSDVSAENRRVNELEHSVVSAENKRVNERIDERVNEKEHSVVSAENKKISSDNKRKSEWNEYEKSKRGKVETNTSKAWKSGQRFQGIDPITGEPISGKILSRAGKVGKSNKNIYNIERDQDGYCGWFDLSSIKDLSEVPDETEMLIFFTNNAVTEAKEQEIQSWIDNDVFEIVRDCGQKCISIRWVITEKVKGGHIVSKARLVARGFEENTSDIKKESPVCSREAIRFLMAIASSKGWNCHTVDVKSAYLQGDRIERTLYLKPPKEYNDGQIWKLKKTVYGLCDAARAWYMKTKNELTSLSVMVCPLDNSLFVCRINGKLEGLVCIYVDDFLWTGTALFARQVIAKLKNKFLIGSSASITFTYVGLSVKSYKNGLTIDQNQYIASLKPIPMSKTRMLDKKENLTESEKKDYRSLVGQLNWVATHTRPDIAFDTCVLSICFYNATVADLLRLNKLVERVQRESVNLYFPRLQNIEKCTLEVYTDASFKNLPNGKSQGGLIIFLQDSFGKRCPIFWKSKKLERTVLSTLAAETQALVEGAQMGVYLAGILRHLVENIIVHVKCYTDSKSLVDALTSTTQVENPRLRQETLVLKDMLDKSEIDPVTWIRSENQLADSLTKRGVCTDKLKRQLSRY